MDVLGRIFSSLANAKFPGGVVGRNLLSAVGACFALAVLAFAARGYPWVLVLLVMAMLLIYGLGSFQANRFAHKYPELATLEGSQITTHYKTVQTFASKGNPVISAAQEVKAVESGSTGPLLESGALEAVRSDAEEE